VFSLPPGKEKRDDHRPRGGPTVCEEKRGEKEKKIRGGQKGKVGPFGRPFRKKGREKGNGKVFLSWKGRKGGGRSCGNEKSN